MSVKRNVTVPVGSGCALDGDTSPNDSVALAGYLRAGITFSP
jgi:hypothetical protein